MKKYALLALPVLLLTGRLMAQSSDESALGTWNILNAKYNFGNGWSAWGELQVRSLRFYDHFHYYEIKGGASYRFNKGFGVLLGLGQYSTYQPGGSFETPLANDEFRTWLQFTMQQNLFEGCKLEHRYRFEQRWTSASGFLQRYRYRINPVVTLIGRESGGDRLFLSLANEIFFDNRPPFFLRNRLFAGLGTAVSPNLTVQAGWQYQYDYDPDDPGAKHFALVALLFDFGRQRVRAFPAAEVD